jgi:putative PIN family toxin of toxin-antitoxin system
MKIVIDTNIFISALLGGKNQLAITQRAARGLDTLFITDDTINELEDVLGRPGFHLSKAEVERRIRSIEGYGRKVAVLPEHKAAGICRDPKDDKFLECALAAGADCIITGDKDLLVLKEYRGTRMITVKDYLDIVNPA